MTNWTKLKSHGNWQSNYLKHDGSDCQLALYFADLMKDCPDLSPLRLKISNQRQTCPVAWQLRCTIVVFYCTLLVRLGTCLPSLSVEQFVSCTLLPLSQTFQDWLPWKERKGLHVQDYLQYLSGHYTGKAHSFPFLARSMYGRENMLLDLGLYSAAHLYCYEILVRNSHWETKNRTLTYLWRMAWTRLE
jgi:hypothetical protein